MKRFPPSVMLLAIVAMAAPAFGQYGLYGSPEMVPLPETTSAVPCSGYAVPAFQPNPSAAVWPHQQWTQTPPAAGPRYAPQPAQPVYQNNAAMMQRPTPAPPAAWAQPRPLYGSHYTPQGGGKPNKAPRVPSPPSPPDTPAQPAASPSDQASPASIPDPAGKPASDDDQFVDYGSMPCDGGGTLTQSVDGRAPSCDGYGYDCGIPPGGYADPYACAPPAYGCAEPGGSVFAACGRMLGYECDPCRPNPWYASGMFLYMSRNDANRVWTSYDWNNVEDQVTNTNDIGLSWVPGGEVTIGRRFGCCGAGSWALEATYFGLDAFSGYHSTTHPTPLGTPLTFGNCQFNSTGANGWFDDAQEHRLWRRNEIHSVEVNLVRTRMLANCAQPVDFEWEMGVRYFRFWEQLRFGTLSSAGAGWHDLAETAYLEDQVTNNLIGGQLGFNAGWYFHPSCRLFIAPKLGIYNNHIEQYANLTLGDGTVATVTTPSNGAFPVKSTKNALSFLTQMDVGLDWQLTQRFSAQVGYRVMVATGMALADHQIPHYINDTPEFAHVATNGELILHGAFAGASFNY